MERTVTELKTDLDGYEKVIDAVSDSAVLRT